MIIWKTFQYRLRPTQKQARALQSQLDECRWLYNHLLEQRKAAYEVSQVSLSKYQQLMSLPQLKVERSSLNLVHSQVLQNVVNRLDKAFQSFFRRCATGEKPGFPRFRGIHRYNSFCFPQSGFSLIGKELKLSKIGSLRVKVHRPIEGAIKTCSLKRNPSGEWDVFLCCAVDVLPQPIQQESIGIDVGLTTFATLSNGDTIANPRFFKQAEKRLIKAQSKLSKLKKGTLPRRKQGKVVAKIHQRIRNQRKEFCHKESKKIIDRYQYICVEDLAIKSMIEGSYFAKSIIDASWNQFRRFLTYKAEEAGRKLGLVDPAYTTQDCHNCGYREKKRLDQRTHDCPSCGYRVSRDFNAAQNILALGLDGLGAIPRSFCL